MTTTYGTQPTQYYLDAITAQQAGGAAVNFVGGTLVVGDGNGTVPALSALIAANGVTHEVWRGQVITSVAVDSNNAQQLDIGVDIPATINGVEVGPFNVTEFAILDASGNCCIVGTTNLQKTVSSQGQTSDLAWIAAVGVGVGSVTLMPPTGSFVTLAQVISSWNGAAIPDCAAPLTKTDTTTSIGWIKRVFGINKATQPPDATSASDLAAMGVGRPATAAEFAAGAGESGGYAWPWPTLQQVTTALTNLANSLTAQINSAIAAIPAALYHRVLTFGTAGTSNFTAPVTGWYWVEVYGAGGGAGVYTGTNAEEGEGGGGGGYAGGWLYLAAGTTVPVTIGAGGTTNGAGSGTAGGTSSFGSYMTATGGGPGTSGGGAGAGGVGSGGQINLAGQTGMSGNIQYYAYVGIGGAAAGPFGGKGGLGSDGNSPTWPGGGGFAANLANGGAGTGSPGANGGVIISY